MEIDKEISRDFGGLGMGLTFREGETAWDETINEGNTGRKQITHYNKLPELTNPLQKVCGCREPPSSS